MVPALTWALSKDASRRSARRHRRSEVRSRPPTRSKSKPRLWCRKRKLSRLKPRLSKRARRRTDGLIRPESLTSGRTGRQDPTAAHSNRTDLDPGPPRRRGGLLRSGIPIAAPVKPDASGSDYGPSPSKPLANRSRLPTAHSRSNSGREPAVNLVPALFSFRLLRACLFWPGPQRLRHGFRANPGPQTRSAPEGVGTPTRA